MTANAIKLVSDQRRSGDDRLKEPHDILFRIRVQNEPAIPRDMSSARSPAGEKKGAFSKVAGWKRPSIYNTLFERIIFRTPVDPWNEMED
jgi:hypothetical protein